MNSLGEVSVTLLLQDAAFERSISRSIGRLSQLQSSANIYVNTSASVANLSALTNALSAANSQAGKLAQTINSMPKTSAFGGGSGGAGTMGSIGGIMDGMKAVYDTLKIVKKEIVDLGMEYDRFEFKLISATGGTVAAAVEMGFVSAEAERLGLRLKGAADMYGTLAASAMGTTTDGETVRKTFTAISEASVALKLSGDQTSGALYAISQMISKGKVSMEELRLQLGERIPGAMLMAQRSMGMTGMEFDTMVRKGELFTDEFLPKFADYMHNRFAKAALEAADSVQGSFERLGTAWDNFKNRLYEGGVGEFFKTLAEVATAALGGVEQSIAEKAGGIANTIGTQLAKGLTFPDVEASLKLLEEQIPIAQKALQGLAEIDTGGDTQVADRIAKSYTEINTQLQRMLTYRTQIQEQYGKDFELWKIEKDRVAGIEAANAALKKQQEEQARINTELEKQEKWMREIQALSKKAEELLTSFGDVQRLNTPQLTGIVGELDAGLKGVADRFASYLEKGVQSQTWIFGEGASPTPPEQNKNPYSFMEKGTFSLGGYSNVGTDRIGELDKAEQAAYELVVGWQNKSYTRYLEMQAAYAEADRAQTIAKTEGYTIEGAERLAQLETKHNEELQLLITARDIELQTEETYLIAKTELEKRYGAERSKIIQDETQKRNQSILSGMQNLYAGMQTAAEMGGKKFLKATQVAGAAVALVDTWVAAVGAMKTGITPAERFAAFSMVFAKGMGAISAIKGVSMGGGSTSGGGGGGTGSIGGGSVPDTRSDVGTNGSGQLATQITIQVDGDVVDLDEWMEKKGSAAIRAAVGRNVNFGLQPA